MQSWQDIERGWVTSLALLFFMHSSSRQPLQNNLLFDTTKGSLGYSFTCWLGLILVGSLVELLRHFLLPRGGGFQKTGHFLDKSEGLGALGYSTVILLMNLFQSIQQQSLMYFLCQHVSQFDDLNFRLPHKTHYLYSLSCCRDLTINITIQHFT